VDLQVDVRVAATTEANERSHRASADTAGNLLNEKSAYKVSGKF
jgi:hypothetical protein